MYVLVGGRVAIILLYKTSAWVVNIYVFIVVASACVRSPGGVTSI
jgi:hypothetical protein